MIFPQNPSPRRAAEVLQRVFDRIPGGFAFRLWDGSVVTLGAGAPVCTAVVHQPQTFVRIMRDPTPLSFAEAYVDGSIDLEGDPFEALTLPPSITPPPVPFLPQH